MPFMIVNLATNESVRGADKSLMLFNHGEDAAAYARRLTDDSPDGIKYQPRPYIEDANAWREREAARIADGTYSPLVWAEESWFKDSDVAREHFAHVSRHHPDKIAYTETPEKGAQDIQTRIRPGRYLQQYFSSVLEESEIHRWAQAHISQYERHGVIVTQNADEIVRVYRTGPHSCMKGDDDDWHGPCHPARVYAGPDLGVAYIEASNGDVSRPVARTVVWPAKKLYSRIYGDDSRLRPALQDMGYTQGYLDGARVQRIPYDGAFVMPYVDSCEKARDAGKYLVLDEDGDICTQQTNGLSGEPEPDWTCDSCGEGMRDDEDPQNYIEDSGATWCDRCVVNHGHICAATGNVFAYSRSVVTLEDGTVWSQEYFDSHGHGCEECGALHRSDDIETVEDADGDSHDLCETCAEDMRDEMNESRRIEDERQLELDIDPDAASRPAGYLATSDRWHVVRYDNATGRRMNVVAIMDSREDAESSTMRLTAASEPWRYVVEPESTPPRYVVRRYDARDGRFEGLTVMHPNGAMNPVTVTEDESLARRACRDMTRQHGDSSIYCVEYEDSPPMERATVVNAAPVIARAAMTESLMERQS